VWAPGLANAGRGEPSYAPSSSAVDAGAEGEGVVGRGLCPFHRKNVPFWISNRRIFVQTGCFLYSSPKAGLNAVPTVKITVRTPFPGVPAGNDPWPRGTEPAQFWSNGPLCIKSSAIVTLNPNFAITLAWRHLPARYEVNQQTCRKARETELTVDEKRLSSGCRRS